MKMNFAEKCLLWAEKTPDGAAIYSVEQGVFTYCWLAENARRFAKVLRRLGVGKGDRYLCILPSIPETAAVFLGGQLIGAVPVMVFSGYGERELEHVFRASEPKLVVTTAAHHVKVAGLITTLAIEHLVVLNEATALMPSFSDLMAESAGDQEPDPVPTEEDDLAELIFTSGTTGAPKGIPHTHGNVLRQCEAMVHGWGGIEPGDVIYTSGPISFAIGLHCHFHLPFFTGASSLYCTERVSPQRFLELVGKYKVTHIMTSAVQLWNVLSIPPQREHLQHIKCLGIGGAAVTGELAKKWFESYGTEIQSSLAMTETLGASFRSKPGKKSADTLGEIVADWEFKLIDPEDPTCQREVLPGETGVLWLKGPTLLPYYWNDPQLTRERIRDGWFNTCDLVRVDADGCLRHMGRADDVIKSAGWRISPIEIEDALKEHPAVRDAVVVGVPDLQRGHIVVAVIIPSGVGSESEELALELRAFARERLAGYKVPQMFLFRENIPRTASGKVQRKLLSQELEETSFRNEADSTGDEAKK